MAAGPTYILAHEDGRAVTPQEVYDAFMSGPVIVENSVDGGGVCETILGIEYTGTPDNVTACTVYNRGGSLTIGGA